MYSDEKKRSSENSKPGSIFGNDNNRPVYCRVPKGGDDRFLKDPPLWVQNFENEYSRCGVNKYLNRSWKK